MRPPTCAVPWQLTAPPCGEHRALLVWLPPRKIKVGLLSRHQGALITDQCEAQRIGEVGASRAAQCSAVVAAAGVPTAGCSARGALRYLHPMRRGLSPSIACFLHAARGHRGSVFFVQCWASTAASRGQKGCASGNTLGIVLEENVLIFGKARTQCALLFFIMRQ